MAAYGFVKLQFVLQSYSLRTFVVSKLSYVDTTVQVISTGVRRCVQRSRGAPLTSYQHIEYESRCMSFDTFIRSFQVSFTR